MRWFAALSMALILAGCAGSSVRSQADQDTDGKMIAQAIRAADSTGFAFNMDEQLVLTGGDVPRGKELRVHATSQDGGLKAGGARLGYHIDQGSSGADFDIVVSGLQVFVKRRGTATWRATSLAATTSFFPALRLDLIRETVLLASSISASTPTHVAAGFARQYAIKPAPDQLEQLQSVVLQGQAESKFLKTATGELDVALGVPGNELDRVEAHLDGTDPATGTRQRVDSWIDLRSARVSAINPPGGAVAVAPEGIFV
jgi:hypothetical protein